MSHRFQGLGRAAGAGLLAGLLGAAVIFVYHAWANAHFQCEFPDTEECTMDSNTALELARLQSYAAFGSCVASAGLFLFLRRR